MTREEAIAIIRKEYLCVDRDCDIERSCGKCDLMMPTKEPILQAYKMAIQALSQECVGSTQKTRWECVRNALEMRCEDAVSREAVKELIKSGVSTDTYDDVEQVCKWIDALPSVTQKSNKYRKEAKRWKNKWLKAQKSGKWIEENHDEYELWICSECGAYTELDMSEEYGCGWKFCPKCGARMESEG